MSCPCPGPVVVKPRPRAPSAVATGDLEACRACPASNRSAPSAIAATDLEQLLAPPYDVLDDADVDALQARSAHNVTYVDVPRGGADRYDEAARTLATWVDDGRPGA